MAAKLRPMSGPGSVAHSDGAPRFPGCHAVLGSARLRRVRSRATDRRGRRRLHRGGGRRGRRHDGLRPSERRDDERRADRPLHRLLQDRFQSWGRMTPCLNCKGSRDARRGTWTAGGSVGARQRRTRTTDLRFRSGARGVAAASCRFAIARNRSQRGAGERPSVPSNRTGSHAACYTCATGGRVATVGN
jgi:hypothetical protein